MKDTSAMEEPLRMTFFDSVSNVADLPAFLPPHSSVKVNEVFNISVICLPEVLVSCDFHTYKDVTLDVGHSSIPCLSPKVCISTAMGSVDLMYRDPNSGFSMIFESGVGLAISFDKNGFVGPIRPLPYHKLGGLSNKMETAGIRTVTWKFRTKTSVMTIDSSSYYVSKAKARLLSPQLLFNAEQGVSGRFVIKKDKATLVFDNVAELIIDYDSGNYLPTSLGKNHIPRVAEVNLGDVLDESN